MKCPGSGIETHTSDYNILLGTAVCQHCKQKVKISKPNKLTGKVKIKKHAALLQGMNHGISA
jgi:hypothetical protein